MQRDGEAQDPVEEGGEAACSMHLVDDYLEPLDEGAPGPGQTKAKAASPKTTRAAP